MQFEYDPEKLIEEVKKRPGIWDFEDIDYRAKHVRNQLWKEVVNELMQTDVKVTKSEMRELGKFSFVYIYITITQTETDFV